MALKKQFATDTDLETQGIIIDYGDVRVRIARAGGSNKRFTRILDQKTRPLRRAIAAGSLDEERGRAILAQAYAEAVVLSWETRVDGEWRTGIDPSDVGENGDELLPDTPENVRVPARLLQRSPTAGSVVCAVPSGDQRGAGGKLKKVLLYALEQGPYERQIIQQCMRERLPLPQRIQDAPELHLGMELYYGAFQDLHTCRPSGWGAQPIPWSAISDYADSLRLDEEQRGDLFYFVRALDGCWLDYHRSKDESGKLQRKNAPKGRSPRRTGR